MSDDFHHPPHVVAALDRVGDLRPDELRDALRVANPRSPDHVPNEVLVRLIRRARVDGDGVKERLVLAALVERLMKWAWRQYSGLSREDREDLVSGIGEALIRDLAKTNGIDFWEITFATKRDRAAADIYQDHLAERYGAEHEEYDADSHGGSDHGMPLATVLEAALIEARVARILTPEEMRYFHALFFSDLPLDSDKAETDLVRFLGRPAGTLREIKTSIKKKLKHVWKEPT